MIGLLVLRHWKLTVFAILTVVIFELAKANASEITIGVAVSQGSGCPAGSVAFSISPDNSAVSVLFSNYSLVIGANISATEGRLSCNLDIPVQVPAGMQIAVVALDYRGFAQLPKESEMVFKTKDGFLIEGKKYEDTSDGEREFKGPLSDNFFISRRKHEINWSSCGGRIDLSLQSSIQLKTNDHHDEALVSIDSVDLGLGFIYRLAARSCHSSQEHGQEYDRNEYQKTELRH